MKKLAKILTLAAAVLMLVTGCKKLPEFTDGSGSTPTPVTPTPTGTLYYHLNEEPLIGSDFISISAKYSSQNDITEMALQVSEDITMNTEVFINTIDFSFPELSGTVNGLQPNTHYYWCISYYETGLHFLTDPVEFTTLENETIPLEPNDTINFDGKIVVLLEDYTGVRCVNCPEAGAIALQLQEQNEGNLVVLGVHPNSALQNPAGGFPDFRTDDGNEWNNYFNIGAYPNGLVNRAGVIGAAEWTSAVNSVIGNDAPVRLIVKTEFDNATRELKVSIHSKFLQTVESNDVRLTTCMMEDNIIGKQATTSGIDENYVHRHVFRGTADGQTWGRVLSSAESISAGSNFITNMKFTLSDEYNADEFYIVAFISDNTNKNVLMAAEKKIK